MEHMPLSIHFLDSKRTFMSRYRTLGKYTIGSYHSFINIPAESGALTRCIHFLDERRLFIETDAPGENISERYTGFTDAPFSNRECLSVFIFLTKGE